MRKRTLTGNSGNEQSTPKKSDIETLCSVRFFSPDGSMKTDATSQHEFFVREASRVPSDSQPNATEFDYEKLQSRLKEKLYTFKPINSETIQADKSSTPGPSNS